MNYPDKIKLPQWQRKRLEILQRDLWQCTLCGCKDRELQVHHKDYFPDKQPWEYLDSDLTTLCKPCHQKENNRDKHETYLIISLRNSGFTAFEILALSNYLNIYSGFRVELRRMIKNAVDLGL